MDEIVNAINVRIAAELQTKPGEKMVEGIAEPVVVLDEAKQTWPAIIRPDGECNVSLFDDQYAIGTYHKMTQINYQENAAKGYGDAKATKREAEMALIVYGARTAANQYDLAERLRDAIAGTRINGREVCSVTNVNFNRALVFAGEFGGIEFFLQPHVFLFRITYKITTALPECTNHKRQ